MNQAFNTTIDLTEIADYRGNLSFAEENNPIPFDIKSVFWTTLTEDVSLCIDAQSFIIILDGKVKINGEEIENPNRGYLANKDQKLKLNIISQEAIVLIVMDSPIIGNDASENVGQLLQMPAINDFHGLKGFFANANATLPFDIKRVYFTYKIPDFAKRGGHAHKALTSIIFAVKGGFDILLDDGKNKSKEHLDSQHKGLHILPGLWREIENFSPESLVLVLASETYCASDYIREYSEFECNTKYKEH